VLALDWRLSAAGFAWANGVIRQYPALPVILTTHELAGRPTTTRLPYQSGDAPRPAAKPGEMPRNDAGFYRGLAEIPR